jgi:hypothetical protein
VAKKSVRAVLKNLISIDVNLFFLFFLKIQNFTSIWKPKNITEKNKNINTEFNLEFKDLLFYGKKLFSVHFRDFNILISFNY